MDDLAEFHREFRAEIAIAADSGEKFVQEAFFEKMGEMLVEAGEMEVAEACFFEWSSGNMPMRVDGFGGDPRESDGIMSLVICDFGVEEKLGALNKTDIQRLFKRLANFLNRSRKPDFREDLEETSDAFALADLMDTRWDVISKVKLILVTNRERKTRGVDALVAGKIGGKTVTYNIWDLRRIQQYLASGRTREELRVGFEEEFGGAVPVLKASGEDATLDSYIAVLPGKQLAAIYEKWGTRLLESNVRSFLQARGKVNKGIRTTIQDEPGMFFSYNNGITATAEAVEIDVTATGAFMTSAENLQIVNGGQTTASIHAALRGSPERLEDVFVQMKLSIVPPERSEDVVPKISEFANSQNKVTAADFFSNSPFHVRMEEFSRRVLAPAGREGYRETKWFYERARGQYADARGKLSVSARKKFDMEFPKAQFLTKTDLAKFEMTWRMKPDLVSYGAQKTFTGPNSKTDGFAKVIGTEWNKASDRFDETWFKRLVSKAITFRRMEKIVPRQEWFEGGYRANVVTYAIAKLVHDVEEKGMVVDLDAVWRAQQVLPVLEIALLKAAAAAHEVITDPPEGIRNMSEWAKRPACWAILRGREVGYDKDIADSLVEPEDAKAVVRSARKEKAIGTGIEKQAAVLEAGAAFWEDLRSWGTSRRLLSQKEDGVLGTCAKIPDALPTEKQAIVAVAVLERLQEEGYEQRLASA